MNVTNNIVIDLQNSKRKHIVEVKQSDRSTRVFRFTVLSGNKPFDMSDVYTATVKGIKPDETVVYAAAEIVKDEDGNITNNLIYTMSDHVTAVSGMITFELQLLSVVGEIVTSFDFYVDVINQLYDEDDIISESDLNGFKAYMLKAHRDAVKAESVEKAFEALYGTLADIEAEWKRQVEECEIFLDNLEEQVESGAFIGARGPQGENGADAIVTEGTQIMGFQIVDGDLICSYYGTGEPNIAMDDNGNLVWSL